ncbi:MAG: CPBP family intramembrane metalloprotease [Planctomycetes bacterium]|nr:CPBP family intramembrane metalloprotease [Planctomycetota bacterium]HPY74772.1 CPBP family intramembrane metalloprotease [Planctomycetota bacterium]HQB00413.1 CPBP family intramembrane metalloprotease [Planctomycetota bacterium]
MNYLHLSSILIVIIDVLFLHSMDTAIRTIPFTIFYIIVWQTHICIPEQHGWSTKIQPNIKYWIQTTPKIAVLLLFFLCVTLTIIHFVDPSIDFQSILQSESPIVPWLISTCLIYPIIEEILYRSLLCTTILQYTNKTTTIIVSGTIFVFLHYQYQNLSPDNIIAGYVLAWSYLKSKNIFIPILFHSLGNIFICLIKCINYYIFM